MNDELFDDAESLARYAAERIAILCRDAVAQRGRCHFVLAGGSTPKRCYQLLREMDLPWTALHIWFGDERCLPVGHIERNDWMADEALLKHVPIPAKQVHRILSEQGPEVAAEAYTALLTDAPAMDIVLLGMGEDGHTASLFPDNPALQDERLAVPVYHSPKPPSERVSMGYSVLNTARHCLIMVAGKGKRDALSRIKAGEKLPVARMTNSCWLIDREAGG